ncbi:MAG: Lrp/AsnC family transcriptional regulator, partial [Pseudomonadales bacterium]
MKNLDSFDVKILRELQQNADISMQDLGERVGLSHTPCWRRVKRLQEDGVIRRRVTLLDGKSLGLEVNVFVQVTLRNHQENGLALFEDSVEDIPEIVECYTVSGDK